MGDLFVYMQSFNYLCPLIFFWCNISKFLDSTGKYFRLFMGINIICKSVRYTNKYCIWITRLERCGGVTQIQYLKIKGNTSTNIFAHRIGLVSGNWSQFYNYLLIGFCLNNIYCRGLIGCSALGNRLLFETKLNEYLRMHFQYIRRFLGYGRQRFSRILVLGSSRAFLFNKQCRWITEGQIPSLFSFKIDLKYAGTHFWRIIWLLFPPLSAYLTISYLQKLRGFCAGAGHILQVDNRRAIFCTVDI